MKPNCTAKQKSKGRVDEKGNTMWKRITLSTDYMEGIH